MNRDIVQLKLQQRLMKERLGVTDSKIDQLTQILKKKSHTTLRPPADEMTKTLAGLTVSDLRFKTYTKILPPISKAEAVPTPVTNERILNIRSTHLQRTVCKQEVQRVTKEKERRRLEKEKKNAARKFPSISIPPSFLPNRYIRGELPCTIEHCTSGHYLSWACPLENLDYDYYLPLFFDGLQCKEQPSCFLATQGIEDMLFAAQGKPERVIACMKALVRPLRNALSKFDVEILLNVLRAIQQLLRVGDGVGAALLPHSKQFLAPMAAFMDNHRNIGDAIDYGQRKQDDIGEEVMKTLEMMEERGGPKALQAIKFCIPLYQSCVKAPDSHHHK